MKLHTTTTLIAFLVAIISYAQPYKPTDMAGGEFPTYTSPTDYRYKGVEIQRQYIMMPDSTLLAADIYLPKGRKDDEKFPVILHQTRYWRAPQIRWPFSMFTNGLLGIYGEMIQRFVQAGYVIVNIDVRGTGASFGRNDYPWSEQEVQDGYDVCEWISGQPWSNQKIGAVGGSYSGTTSEFLASTCHPNVKAVAPLYALYDVYDDIAFPNGNHFVWFTTHWGNANSELDNNQLPTKNPIYKTLISGVAKVPGKHKNEIYKAAIQSHKDNIGVNETSNGVDYRNRPPSNKMIETMDVFSPHTVTSKINACGPAVYCYSGWYDGDYQHAAVKRFLNLKGSRHLTIGPWNHGGKLNCSPGNPGPSAFDHAAEMLRFFDYYLKGFDTGIDKDAPVHYYTMGEEKWKAARQWPPEGFSPITYYFQKGGKIGTEKPGNDTTAIRYTIDNTIGTGNDTRWKSLKSELKTPYAYSDLKYQLRNAQLLRSHPLPDDMEITGHPLVYLYFSSTATDGSVFTYLIDEDEDGNWKYITEGELRLIHRKTGDCSGIYQDVVPCHTYNAEDASALVPGQTDSVNYDMLPVSYRIEQGHKFVIAVTNSDVAHFKVYQPEGTVFTVYHSDKYPSRIVLPVR